jgi:hypothetical protein
MALYEQDVIANSKVQQPRVFSYETRAGSLAPPLGYHPQMTAPHRPQIRLYQEWLQANRGLSFDSYDALWQWSVTDLDAFWQSIWDYFDLQSPTPHSAGRQLLRHIGA